MKKKAIDICCTSTCRLIQHGHAVHVAENRISLTITGAETYCKPKKKPPPWPHKEESRTPDLREV